MATCKKEFIDRVVQTVVKDEVFTLKMTRNEAETLQLIMQCVGGSTITSRRKFAQNIVSALDGVYEGDLYDAVYKSLGQAGGQQLILHSEDWVPFTQG